MLVDKLVDEAVDFGDDFSTPSDEVCEEDELNESQAVALSQIHEYVVHSPSGELLEGPGEEEQGNLGKMLEKAILVSRKRNVEGNAACPISESISTLLAYIANNELVLRATQLARGVFPR
ncbi:uncharacterized protein LOC106866249 isoform X2 [Brachypodium distachyon]|uniref:uncharacterized protein LOC106866249 isoform X2 n=1 Tax=Brachypodium distachyon TaxID=15368 RepID=UPI000D0D0768|nr:uncharacterized protein LOC106866249 isoform X2 [Brachypodium distachyon]|eukprot:XP_024315167.1 uncharacterized protein LOC106866249 isoform X2 [Brachypodium distachyon]